MSSERDTGTFSTDRLGSAGESPRPRGRPATDHFLRRMEIYFQALPMLAELSGRDVHLEAVARQSGMSLGGLRYYFPNRDDLLFFPLLPKTCDAVYTSLVRTHGNGGPEPGEFLAWFLRSFSDGAVASRVSARMAIEAGDAFFLHLANSHPELDWVEVRKAIAVLGGHAKAQDAEWLRRFLRRQFLAATLDANANAEDIASDLRYALGVAR